MLGDLAGLVANVYAVIDVAITRLETHARNLKRKEMLEFYLLYSQFLLADSQVYDRLLQSPLPIAQLLLQRISCWCTEVMSVIERMSRCQTMRKKMSKSNDIDLEISQLETSYQSILLMLQNLGVQLVFSDGQKKADGATTTVGTVAADDDEPAGLKEATGIPVVGTEFSDMINQSVKKLKGEYSKLCESGVGVRVIQEKLILAALDKPNGDAADDKEANGCNPAEHLEKTLRNMRPPRPAPGLPRDKYNAADDDDDDDLNLECRMQRLKTDASRLQFGEIIGKGAFGDVYKGVRDGVCRVALKVIPTADIFSPDERREVFGEIFALRMASHENIVRLLGFSEVPNRGLVLVLELCTCSLSSLLTKIRRARKSRDMGMSRWFKREDNTLKPWESSLLDSLVTRLQLGRQLTSAVHYLHNVCSPSIVHRDIKSANVLLQCVPTEEGDLQVIGKLCDFGMAKICSFVTSHRGSFQESVHLGGRAGVGSFPWMSPEAMDMEDISYPADIFSLGVLLWELVTCNKPWGHVQRPELILTNILVRGKRLPLDDELFSESLSGLLRSMWAAEPGDRPNAVQTLQSLDQIVDSLQEPDQEVGDC